MTIFQETRGRKPIEVGVGSNSKRTPISETINEYEEFSRLTLPPGDEIWRDVRPSSEVVGT